MGTGVSKVSKVGRQAGRQAGSQLATAHSVSLKFTKSLLKKQPSF